jgi:hypothetical protein
LTAISSLALVTLFRMLLSLHFCLKIPPCALLRTM